MKKVGWLRHVASQLMLACSTALGNLFRGGSVPPPKTQTQVSAELGIVEQLFERDLRVALYKAECAVRDRHEPQFAMTQGPLPPVPPSERSEVRWSGKLPE